MNPTQPHRSPLSGPASGPGVVLRSSIEAITSGIVLFSPWAFASVHPAAILILDVALSIALLLWAALLVLNARVRLRFCPIFLGFTGMVSLGIIQLLPLQPLQLAAISPGTAELLADLTPEHPESLLGEDPITTSHWTISLDPNLTRERVVQLLGLMALFAVVRFAVASPRSFHRFAVLCTINGALLSLFALAQQFSSPDHAIFWTFPTRQGAAFGPFVCRNNFPDYVNVCIGLAAAVLLSTRVMRKRGLTVTTWLVQLGQHPIILWLIAAMGFMVAAVLLSLSRGGAIGLASGCVVFVILAVRTGQVKTSLALFAVALIAIGGTLAWLGADVVEQRLNTLTDQQADEGRVRMWLRVLPLVRVFPFWGSGYGTFVSIEPLTRQPGDERLLDWDNAHNDFLEALIEGGFINLLLLLLIIVAVYRTGLRALNAQRGLTQDAHIIGGLAGLTAVIVHSFGDFGTHIPAVAVLLTVLVAHLSACGDDPELPPGGRQWQIIPNMAACVVVAIALPLDGWFRERAEFYRLAAIRAGNQLPPGQKDRVIRYLESAAAYSPGDALLRLRLAEVEYEEYLACRDRERDSSIKHYLRPALRDYLRLRAANPLYSQSHGRLAGNREYLHQPDTVAHYLGRATRLRPTDEGLWYLAGLNELAQDQLDQAWTSWQRSLTCAPTYLNQILPVAINRLGPSRTVECVLPANPILLQEAARSPLFNDRPEQLREFSATACQRLGECDVTDREALYARACLLRQAGHLAEAINAYETLILRYSGPTIWRLELAQLELEEGNLGTAERLLREVVRENPNLDGTRELNEKIIRARVNHH